MKKRISFSLVFAILLIGFTSGCSIEESKSEKIVMEYLETNYPDYSFNLIKTDGNQNAITYWATEKNHKSVTTRIAYYPSNGDIKENIPVALISNEFKEYICNKISESFPNSKVYIGEDYYIDDWNSWDKYEYSLQNYLQYLEKFGVSGRRFTVVLDSNTYDNRISQLNNFYSKIEEMKYISLRLFYVPTEYVSQADNYYTGSGFDTKTPFYKSRYSEEWIYVHGYEEKRFLYSTKDGKL